MRRRKQRAAAGVIAPEMNVTPLVDVVLVLLIIFMVVAPRLEHDIPLRLPSILHPDPELQGGADPLRVSIPRAGEFYFDDRPHDLDGAITALTQAHVAEPLRRLAVRADVDLTYGELRGFLDRAREVGFPGISLLAEEGRRLEEPGPKSRESSDPEVRNSRLPSRHGESAIELSRLLPSDFGFRAADLPHPPDA